MKGGVFYEGGVKDGGTQPTIVPPHKRTPQRRSFIRGGVIIRGEIISMTNTTITINTYSILHMY